MMTPESFPAQTLSEERAALFPTGAAEEHTPKNAQEPPTTSDVIILGEDFARILSPEARLDARKRIAKKKLIEESKENEASQVVQHIGEEISYAHYLVDDEEKRGALAEGFAKTVENFSVDVSEQARSDLAQQALKSLQRIPRRRLAKRFAQDMSQKEQLIQQHSKELQGARDDMSSVETTLRERRTELIKKLMATDDASDIYEQIRSEIQFINSVLDRSKTPVEVVSIEAAPGVSTDELETSLQHLTPETASPARGTEIARIAKAIGDKALHVVKDVFILDDLAEDEETESTATKVLTEVR